MFAHTEVARQKEYDCRICQGCWQPLPERDLWAEVPTMELDNMGNHLRIDHGFISPGIPTQKEPQRGTLLGGHYRRDLPRDHGDAKGVPLT